MLQELGRLREVTFRLAGEGTGKRRDLDRFDRYYWHVLLWHKAKQELVGAYRAGNTAEILAERGVSGLYTSTCFRYDARVFEKIGPGTGTGTFLREAGIPAAVRSTAFVVEGNCAFAGDACGDSGVVWRGEHQQRLQQSLARDDLPLLRSAHAGRRVGGTDRAAAAISSGKIAAVGLPRHVPRLRDLEELSQPITDVETDGKGLPILLRQYAKIGGKLLGFNVDRKFSNVLDGLVVVDLRKTAPAVLERYMGREAAMQFRTRHGL